MQRNFLKIQKFKTTLNISTLKKEYNSFIIKQDCKLIESNYIKSIRSAKLKSYFSGNLLEIKNFG